MVIVYVYLLNMRQLIKIALCQIACALRMLTGLFQPNFAHTHTNTQVDRCTAKRQTFFTDYSLDQRPALVFLCAEEWLP